MSQRKQLRELAESIIDAYEIRVNTIESLMTQAYQFLITFRSELTEMVGQLQTNLAVLQKLRRKDFNGMISDVLVRHQVMENEASENLERFRKEEYEMIRCLRNILSDGGASGIEDVEFIRTDILNRQKEREQSVIKILKQFQIEQEELRAGLKRLLDKGDNVTIKDFRTMLKAIRIQQSPYNKDLLVFIEDFDLARNKIQNQWQKVAGISS